MAVTNRIALACGSKAPYEQALLQTAATSDTADCWSTVAEIFFNLCVPIRAKQATRPGHSAAVFEKVDKTYVRRSIVALLGDLYVTRT